MEAKLIEAKLTDMANRHDLALETITQWINKTTPNQIAQPNIVKFLECLLFCYETVNLCLNNDVDTARQKIERAVEEIDAWYDMSHSKNEYQLSNWHDRNILDRNTVWAMYVGLEAATEIIVEWEYNLVSIRARVHEEEDVIFSLEEECLLSRVRSILSCYETAICCWQNKVNVAQQKVRVAKYEIGSWQQLRHSAG